MVDPPGVSLGPLPLCGVGSGGTSSGVSRIRELTLTKAEQPRTKLYYNCQRPFLRAVRAYLPVVRTGGTVIKVKEGESLDELLTNVNASLRCKEKER